MKKKFLLASLLFSFFIILSVFNCSAAPLSPALNVISYQNEITVNGICGNDINFSKDVFKELLGCKILKKIKITNLPDESQGILTLKDQKVKAGDSITSKELNNLTYKPSPNSHDTEFSFTVFSEGTDYNVNCKIVMLNSLNFSPIINTEESGAAVSTFESISYYSDLSATDPENDSITFEILKYPQKGMLVLKDNKKGSFCYTPFDGASGKDSFSYIAIDSMGNRSSPQELYITIRPIENGAVYSDMKESKYELAATVLSEKGILTGEKVGNNYIFHPDRMVSKGEFLMYAMNASNITPCGEHVHCDNIFPSDFSDEPIKQYVLCGYTQGYLSGILSPNDVFQADSPITFAEAAAIINKICGFQYSTHQFVFATANSTPARAMLEVETLLKNCNDINIPNDPFNSTITRGQCAEILYKSILNLK